MFKDRQKFRIKQIFNFRQYTQKKNEIEDKIIADACESLIGAIYLDGGFVSAEKFILKLWNNEIKKTFKTQIDAKTKLQEFSLKIYKRLPLYKTIKSFGPKHKLIYKVEVKIENSAEFVGNGKSIKIAQQNAAKKLLDNIGI